MKLKAKKAKTEASAPQPAVVPVPGDFFFTRRLDIPAEMGPDETAGFVALQLEELSPFPLEQLYHGHVRSRDGTAVFVFAAYRRRFAAEQIESWPAAMFVLPDFAPVLQSSYDRETIVFLRSATGLSALLFEANRELPARVVSRPLDAAASPETLDLLRRSLAERLGARTAQQVFWRTEATAVPRPKGLEFALLPEESGAGTDVFLAADDCWAMDVRDPGFVAQRRKQLGFDVVLWRVVVGAAAALALLLVGEVILVGGRAYGAWLEQRVEKRAPLVTRLEQKNSIGIRLSDFGLSGAQPFDMLAVVGGVKPDEVTLSRATVNESNVLLLEGTADDIGFMNAFEAAMRSTADVAEVRIGDYRSDEGGTRFDMTVTFRADAFDGAATAPVAATGGGA